MNQLGKWTNMPHTTGSSSSTSTGKALWGLLHVRSNCLLLQNPAKKSRRNPCAPAGKLFSISKKSPRCTGRPGYRNVSPGSHPEVPRTGQFRCSKVRKTTVLPWWKRRVDPSPTWDPWDSWCFFPREKMGFQEPVFIAGIKNTWTFCPRKFRFWNTWHEILIVFSDEILKWNKIVQQEYVFNLLLCPFFGVDFILNFFWEQKNLRRRSCGDTYRAQPYMCIHIESYTWTCKGVPIKP